MYDQRITLIWIEILGCTLRDNSDMMSIRCNETLQKLQKKM